jgi:hypothetical protein
MGFTYFYSGVSDNIDCLLIIIKFLMIKLFVCLCPFLNCGVELSFMTYGLFHMARFSLTLFATRFCVLSSTSRIKFFKYGEIAKIAIQKKGRVY